MKRILILFIFVSISISSQANGITIDFGDYSNYWPGWRNWTADDSKDTIGVPNFTGGNLVLTDNGYLKNITFYYKADNYLNLWNLLTPGDLFIDVGANKSWNYVVNTLGKTDPGIYGLYYSSDTGFSNYKFSNDTFDWSRYDIRDHHPVGIIDLGGDHPMVNFSGWAIPNSIGDIVSSTFDFSGLSGGGIYIGSEDFILSWTVNCANDVVYEQINPVPEPATIILMGSGLIGIGIFTRRRFKK